MTKRPRGTPANLTGVIENSRDAWDKLWWNLQQFEYALSDRSNLGAAQAYALIDYAVAESALHAWVLASLTPREERVLRMRFGIGMNTDHTLEEVGQQFSVTRERIRQIEAKALRKLKHPSRSRKMRSFLDQ